MDGATLAKVELIKAWIPFCIQIVITVGAIATAIINNRKKTEASLAALGEKVDGLDKKLDKHIKENEFDNAKQVRVRILRFYDELCRAMSRGEIPCSESHYEDIMDDCSYYKRFTVEHPDFKNSRGEVAMEYIEKTYHEIKTNGGFLVQAS